MYIRVSQKTVFSVKNSMTEGKRKLEWRRVRKYIRFLILFIPRSSNCKKPFRGFSEILIHKISYEFTSLSIFYQIKNSEKYIISFSGTPYWLHSIEKICACAKRIFWFWFLCIAGRSLGLMKSKIVKVISFYNNQPSFAPGYRIFNFFSDTLMYIHG